MNQLEAFKNWLLIPCLILTCCGGCAGADIKDVLPDSATSSSARAALNERTSNLPSFSDVGDSLKNVLGGTNDPKDIGRAIDRNTPGMWLSAVYVSQSNS